MCESVKVQQPREPVCDLVMNSHFASTTEYSIADACGRRMLRILYVRSLLVQLATRPSS